LSIAESVLSTILSMSAERFLSSPCRAWEAGDDGIGDACRGLLVDVGGDIGMVLCLTTADVAPYVGCGRKELGAGVVVWTAGLGL
jgi:hypothetical protein